jgi:two-component system chemotaxis response regulator CheB
MNIKNIIVIGASAGGIKAIYQLIEKIPPDLAVAMFIVIHISKNSRPDIIAEQLQKKTAYTCLMAEDNELIKSGHIYLAPTNRHLLVKNGFMRLIDGPHENRWRPSIDVLFRSAAAVYDSKVIGIILSGMLDDGTSGMSAIKRCGGICLVQEPAEAEYIDMPVNVIKNVNVDYQVPVADMGYIIDDILSKPHHSPSPIPEDVKLEAEITERMVSDVDSMTKIATPSDLTCPDCGGRLSQINNEPDRYRCHTGHVYIEPVLLDKQGEELEESIWTSIRMMEERRNLLQNMVWRHERAGNNDTANYQQAANTLNMHIDRLKQLLLSFNKTDVGDKSYL